MNASCATIVLVKLAIKQFSFVQDRNAPLAMDLTVVGMVNCSSALLNARNWLGMFVNEVGITIDVKFCTSKNTFPTMVTVVGMTIETNPPYANSKSGREVSEEGSSIVLREVQP